MPTQYRYVTDVLGFNSLFTIQGRMCRIAFLCYVGTEL